MSNTIKVGVFMTIALAVVAYLIIRSEDLALFGPEGVRYEARFDSVAGLDDKSAIRLAGVRIGRVDGIRLEAGRAVATLLVEETVDLREGTVAQIANLGLLGDKYVELVPGPTDAPLLEPGATIPGKAPPSVDEVIASLSELGDSLGTTMREISGQAPADGPVGRLIVNLEAASAELRDLLAANRDQLDATIANFQVVSESLARELPRISSQLDGLLGEVRGMVEENRGEVSATLENVERLTTDLRAGVTDLNRVAAGLAEGEGTLGKLLTSDEAHDELVATMDSVQAGVDSLSESLGTVQRLRLDLAMEGYLLEDQDESRAAFRLDLDPRSGRYYRIELVDTPRGKETTDTEIITVVEPDGTTSTRTIETVRLEDEITYSALLGLPLFEDEERFRLWTGLIESSFGVELEYRPTETAWLSLEAFDFDRHQDLDPHLRLTAGWKFHRYLYLVGGYDDPLVDDLDSFFLGGGIRWRDDDLKYLLGSLPRF